MSTYRELIYIVSDLAKQLNDDTTMNENHIAFLLDKYRIYLLKQKYGKDYSLNIPSETFQTICVDLKKEVITQPSCNDDCLIDSVGDIYLKSINKIPAIFDPQLVRVASNNSVFKSSIAFISPERMYYVGDNKWLKNVIYSTVYYDGHLYLKSSNSNLYTEVQSDDTTKLVYDRVYLSAIFEDPKKAFNMKHCNDYTCSEAECKLNNSFLDIQFPIEGALEVKLISMVLAEILNASYRPADKTNNASDDLSDLASFISKYLDKPKQTES